jgi:hypothetical protein
VTHPRDLDTSARQVIDRVVIAAPTSRCDPEAVRGPDDRCSWVASAASRRFWAAMRRPACWMGAAAPPRRRRGEGFEDEPLGASQEPGDIGRQQVLDGRGQTGGRERRRRARLGTRAGPWRTVARRLRGLPWRETRCYATAHQSPPDLDGGPRGRGALRGGEAAASRPEHAATRRPSRRYRGATARCCSASC